jgi:RNA:NAD 2'-phosphotransferase (TPT1/KptA family)
LLKAFDRAAASRCTYLSIQRLPERFGERHGKATVLIVNASRMHVDGYNFVQADNGVWLTDHVPSAYLGFEDPM